MRSQAGNLSRAIVVTSLLGLGAAAPPWAGGGPISWRPWRWFPLSAKKGGKEFTGTRLAVTPVGSHRMVVIP